MTDGIKSNRAARRTLTPPVIPNRGVHLMNEWLNRTLRVDSRLALNSNAAVAEMPTQHLAEGLRRVVNEIQARAYDPERQRIDYMQVRDRQLYADLRRRTAQLNFFDPTTLQSDGERIAFWVNLYNVLIVDAVIALGIRQTVWQDKGFFRRAAYRIGGLRCSADEIEHGILRGNRRPPYIPFTVFARNDPRRQWAVSRLDPRVHCALNCASRSCPPIAVYTPEAIDAQLEVAAHNLVNATTEVVWNENGGLTLRLSSIFKWYRVDFGGFAGVLDFIDKYLLSEKAQESLAHKNTRPKIEWTHYDWALNQVA